MRYISIDLETTGLDPLQHDIIEFAAVVENTEYSPPVDSLSYCSWHIGGPDDNMVWNRDTLDFHLKIGNLQRWQSVQAIPCGDLPMKFAEWLSFNGLAQEKILFAGKNVANFDIQFLKNLVGWDQIKYHHRYLDPAMLYMEKGDDYPPSLQTCLERAMLDPLVKHEALADARQVIELLRRKLP